MLTHVLLGLTPIESQPQASCWSQGVGYVHRLPAEQATVPFPVPGLYEEFQDLLPWADSIFEKHFENVKAAT